MKKQILSFLFLFAGASLFSQEADPVIMLINNKEIRKSDFEYLYKKNNAYQQQSDEKLSDYKDLFINLKLKVEEAEAMEFDTTAEFQKEYQQYRAQAARPYLQDTAFYEKYLRKMYDRTRREREVSQIFVALQPNAAPADTLKAYEKIMGAYKRLQKGDSLEEIVFDFTNDKRYDGNLGYVSGFVTVLPFEEMVYATPVGQFSAPFRTQYGYHIIRINAEREAKGEVQVAHIMKRFPKDGPQDSIDMAKKRIDAVYERLKNGEDFFSVAKEETEHEYSKKNGGRISSFHFGQSLAGIPFDSVAFSLKAVGEVSEPVQSWYGWHIIKLLDKKAPGSFEKDRSKIANLVNRMPDRKMELQIAFLKHLEDKYNFAENKQAVAALAAEAQKAATDEQFMQRISAMNMKLATFADQQLTVKDFAEQLPEYGDSLRNDISIKCKAFCNQELVEYEDRHLEEIYPEFRMLMQEYYDGMQMFAVSNKMIWEKAASDEEGLKAFFEANKSDYTWDVPRFKGMLICCRDKKTAAQAKKIEKTSPADKLVEDLLKLNTDDKMYVHIEKGLFKQGENQFVDKYVFKQGNYKSEEFPVVFPSKASRVLKDGPDEYTDIKGLVISDYQNYLEKEWIKELRAKYPVVVNEEVLNTLK
ncbi:MAG: peptidylprolyl isomerase [Paludibacteraceae bacterium]|nr:peptidylprolyl isomerase [Paludibacteraceae bacterium]